MVDISATDKSYYYHYIHHNCIPSKYYTNPHSVLFCYHSQKNKSKIFQSIPVSFYIIFAFCVCLWFSLSGFSICLSVCQLQKPALVCSKSTFHDFPSVCSSFSYKDQHQSVSNLPFRIFCWSVHLSVTKTSISLFQVYLS